MTEPNGGHEPNGGNGDGGGTSTNAQKQQYELLGFIQILSFTASPPQVTPFEPTTLSWSVRLPTNLHVPVSLTVAGQTSHGTSGNATAAPFATTEYGLAAETAIVSRVIGALTVPVDGSACKSGQIPGIVITNRVKEAITEQFQGSSDFSLRGNGVSVDLSDTIAINIPLSLNIPDWFDATMTIAIQIEVGMQGVPPQASIFAQASTNVDVSWEWYSTLLSLGITSAVADGMQKIAQAFMSEIAQNQIASAIADEVNGQVQALATGAQQGDPGGRAFKLTSLTVTSDGITFTVCPTPSPVSHPVGPPVEDSSR
jgi:hypothetical protein